MFEKIKKLQNNPYLNQMRDIRFTGLIVFGILALLVSWSGLNVIQTNYDLQRQVSELEQENAIMELENNNLKLSNQYYDTDQYLELSARRQFGKALPGEKLVLVPKHVALAHTLDLNSSSDQKAAKPKSTKPTYQRNFEAWMRFFMHRQNGEE